MLYATHAFGVQAILLRRKKSLNELHLRRASRSRARQTFAALYKSLSWL